MFDIDRYAPEKKNRSIFRLLKFYWKRYLRWNRLNNEKREMKQYKKEKYIPKLPKLNNNATIILVVLICAFSYIYVEHSKIVYQEKIRNEKELEETNQRSQLEDCLSDAETNYKFNWNKQCKSLGKKMIVLFPHIVLIQLKNGEQKQNNNVWKNLKTKLLTILKILIGVSMKKLNNII